MEEKIEFDGHCALACSFGKTDLPAPKYKARINGKTYAFANPIARWIVRRFPSLLKKAENRFNQSR